MIAIIATAAVRPRQSGRTLLELMIAITLSVIIALGLVIYYSSAAKVANVSHQLSALQDEAPLTALLIGQAVKRAGYGEIIGTGYVSNGQTLFDGPHLRGCKGGQFTSPAAGDFTCTPGAAGAQDALMVRFQANSVVGPDQFPTRNCVGAAAVGTPITTPTHIAVGTVVPIVQNVYSFDSNRILCSGNGSAAEVLAHDITEFRVYYGYDEDAANAALTGGFSLSPRGSTLVDADQIWARQAAFTGMPISAWDYVVSVQLCLVMRTRNPSTSVQSTGFAYTGCPESASDASNGTGPARIASDATIYRTFRQVFTVRSRATASPSVAQ